MVIKTGEVYWRDAEDLLWHAESFEETDTGEVWTTQTLVEDGIVPRGT